MSRRRCPVCKLDHNPPRDATIESGDYTVCPDCAAVLVIDGEILRRVTVEEWCSMHPEVFRLVNAAQQRVIQSVAGAGFRPQSIR